MKFLRLTVFFASISGLLLFTACGGGGGEEDPIEKVNLKALSGTWTCTKATFDGNTSAGYGSMTITISGTFSKTPGTSYDYSVTGLPVGTGVKTPWPRTISTATVASGTWRFDEDQPGTLIYREDAGGDLAVTYTVTASKLTLTFEFEGAGYRTSSVDGGWNFEFVPQ